MLSQLHDKENPNVASNLCQIYCNILWWVLQILIRTLFWGKLAKEASGCDYRLKFHKYEYYAGNLITQGSCIYHMGLSAFQYLSPQFTCTPISMKIPIMDTVKIHECSKVNMIV